MDWGEIHGNWLCCCAASFARALHQAVTARSLVQPRWAVWHPVYISAWLIRNLGSAGRLPAFPGLDISPVLFLVSVHFFFFTALTPLNCWGIPYPLDYSPVRSAGHEQWFHVWSSPLSHLQGDYKHFILPFFFFLLCWSWFILLTFLPDKFSSQFPVGIGKIFFCHYCSYTLHSCVTANKGSTWFMSAFSNNRSWAQSRSFWGRTMTISALVKGQSSGLLRISIPTTVMTNKVAKNV